ncbi:MAG: shikimate dehydrogenase [Eubacteriales bacterium]|nr:shikimate dehydrogenase [Eubacteriales bacterium]
MRYGLLGKKLGHSFSKEIHEKLGRYTYELIELTPEELDVFLREKAFAGVNVTIPYKQTVIPYLDACSPRAEAIGAVNTIVNRDGKLFGDNTDFGGLEALIRRMDLELEGRTVLIAGTGGTSRTAAAVAQSMGAAAVYRLSRTGREGAMLYEDAYEKLTDAGILINTTPAGMYPDIDGIAVDPGRFPNLEGVIDVIYNPLETRLMREAAARGIPAENGLYMLVAQAVLAAEDFTGETFGKTQTDRIYREILEEKQHG